MEQNTIASDSDGCRLAILFVRANRPRVFAVPNGKIFNVALAGWAVINVV